MLASTISWVSISVGIGNTGINVFIPLFPCLESGADDYLRKPVLPAQLLAHIHMLSRRAHTRLVEHPSSIIAVGPIRVDLLSHEVTINGQVPHLSPTESKLLRLFAMHANTIPSYPC